MFELIGRLVARLKEIWDAMTLNQKVVSGGVLVALIIAFAFLSTLRENFVNYTVLFTEMDAVSASEITSRLEQQNIPYRLSRDGTTIEVPENKATQLKVELTAEGLPKTGIVGFEILDTTTFGMSERIQEVQIQRALQGELSKALMTLDAVNRANVILSIPEQRLFTEMEKPVTASIILDLRRGRSLSQKNIEGLTYLIGYAVPGLDPTNVTIIDTQGNSLTKTYRDEIAMLSSTQWEFKVMVDKNFEGKVKRMLDGAFGPGSSLVTVNAELDWDRVERVTTSYDQDRSALLSEERDVTTEPTPDGIGESEYSLINYENSQIVENFIKTPGDISRLTVSVFIDRRDSTWVDEDGETQVAKFPWSDVQLASIQSITEKAVGYNAARGDEIEVYQTEFEAAEIGIKAEEFTIMATIVESLRIIVMGIALVGAIALFYLVLRNIAAMLDPSKMSIKADKEFEKEKMELREEEVLPQTERDILVRNILKVSKEDAEMAAKTLKSFFR